MFHITNCDINLQYETKYLVQAVVSVSFSHVYIHYGPVSVVVFKTSQLGIGQDASICMAVLQ